MVGGGGRDKWVCRHALDSRVDRGRGSEWIAEPAAQHCSLLPLWHPIPCEPWKDSHARIPGPKVWRVLSTSDVGIVTQGQGVPVEGAWGLFKRRASMSLDANQHD